LKDASDLLLKTCLEYNELRKSRNYDKSSPDQTGFTENNRFSRNFAMFALAHEE